MFKPKFTITNKINNNMTIVERARGFIHRICNYNMIINKRCVIFHLEQVINKV